jgi:hypothetical protein
MKKNILSRERLAAIERAIDRNGGEITTRNLDRIHGIEWRVLKEAETAGFIELSTRKGRTGRPSLVVKKVSNSHPTKLPLHRSEIESLITQNQWGFAFHYVLGEYGPGFFDFRRRAYVAYQKTYREARSKEGAKASASRLLRKGRTQAAIQWTFAKQSHEDRGHHLYPSTTSEVWNALREIGSFRADWAPWRVKWEWDNEREKR